MNCCLNVGDSVRLGVCVFEIAVESAAYTQRPAIHFEPFAEKPKPPQESNQKLSSEFGLRP